ncbi:MATE family efflux transporter, partial [Streptomyces sp. SID724]|nr:MATE family efflux transporter [Streptomyces sp. SID724]
ALAVGLRVLRRSTLVREATGARSAEGARAASRRTLATGLPMSADFTVRQGAALVLVAIVARLGVPEVA